MPVAALMPPDTAKIDALRDAASNAPPMLVTSPACK
jgi:hypothetical protein